MTHFCGWTGFCAGRTGSCADWTGRTGSHAGTFGILTRLHQIAF